MERADPRPLRVCVHDHAASAGAANRGEGLAGGRPIGAARSARGRVIAGVLFTCSQSDSDRDRDVSARGENTVDTSWRHGAPHKRHASPLPPPSTLMLCTLISLCRLCEIRLFPSSFAYRERPHLFASPESLRPSLHTHFSFLLSHCFALSPLSRLRLSHCFLFYTDAMNRVLSNKHLHILSSHFIIAVYIFSRNYII